MFSLHAAQLVCSSLVTRIICTQPRGIDAQMKCMYCEWQQDSVNLILSVVVYNSNLLLSVVAVKHVVGHLRGQFPVLYRQGQILNFVLVYTCIKQPTALVCDCAMPLQLLKHSVNAARTVWQGKIVQLKIHVWQMFKT